MVPVYAIDPILLVATLVLDFLQGNVAVQRSCLF